LRYCKVTIQRVPFRRGKRLHPVHPFACCRLLRHPDKDGSQQSTRNPMDPCEMVPRNAKCTRGHSILGNRVRGSAALEFAADWTATDCGSVSVIQTDVRISIVVTPALKASAHAPAQLLAMWNAIQLTSKRSGVVSCWGETEKG